MRRTLALVAGLTVFVTARPSLAADPHAADSSVAEGAYPKPKAAVRSWNYVPAWNRVTWSSQSVIRYNPLGLQEMFELGYERRLFDTTNILFKESFVGLAFTPIVTPAFVNPGLTLRVQPLAVWRFDLRAGAAQYFGNFNLLQSWAKPETATFSDSELKEQGTRAPDKPKESYATTGTNYSIINEFRMGLLMDEANRPAIEARNRTWAMYHRMNLQPGDTVWYDQYFDLLAPKEGWTVSNDLDVIARFNLKGTSILRVGVRYNWAKAYIDGNTREDVNEGTHRVGPIVAYTLYDEPGGRVNRPTIIGILNWHTQHPYRTGQDVTQALPYIVVGYQVSGDLLP